MPTTTKYDREIATIKADVAAMGHLFQKLDDAMDKIGTASANISSISVSYTHLTLPTILLV